MLGVEQEGRVSLFGSAASVLDGGGRVLDELPEDVGVAAEDLIALDVRYIPINKLPMNKLSGQAYNLQISFAQQRRPINKPDRSGLFIGSVFAAAGAAAGCLPARAHQDHSQKLARRQAPCGSARRKDASDK